MIVELFSKRQKKLRGEVPDVYSYDDLPDTLRVQIVHIWRYSGTREAYELLAKTLCREYGVFQLPVAKQQLDTFGRRFYLAEFCDFFLQTRDTERALDAVELSFQIIDRATRDFRYLCRQDAAARANAAIEALNERFREHGVGYEFADGKIIRVDSSRHTNTTGTVARRKPSTIASKHSRAQ